MRDNMDKEKEIQRLNKKISVCRRCELHKYRIKAVPGEGNINAKIMFIGQAPGKTENKTGRPFVGRAGKLLDKLLDFNNIKRKDIFITSVVRCFPPKNRVPKPKEIKTCVNLYLKKYIELIDPQFIILLGSVALKTMLNESRIERVHGKIIKRDRIYIPTYHPAAALRFPKIKAKIEKDFKKIKRLISL